MTGAAGAKTPESDAGRLLETVAASPRLLVALDFDGTLAPLTDEPMKARALPEAARAVADLAASPDTVVALVSGRTLAHLREISEHADTSPIHLAGSHGAEFWHPAGFEPMGDAAPSEADEQPSADPDDLRAAAEAAIEGLEGAWVEPKAFGFGLHTRLCAAADAVAAASAVDQVVSERAPTWRRRTGRDILEFAWRHEGKDSAVAALRAQTGATAVVFAGDDVTDEDALASLGETDLGIRVGGGESAARLHVADAEELAGVLFQLARMRAAARS